MNGDQMEDPSEQLTRVAESIAATAQRQVRRDPWRTVAVASALVIVAITAFMVGYVLLVTTDSRTNAEVSACRGELASAVQVGVARALSNLSEAALEDGDTGSEQFDRQLERAAKDLTKRAEAYDAGAKAATADPDLFLEQCQERR